MNPTGYKILGFVVWQGGRLYLRRNAGRRLPSARTAGASAGLVALALGGLLLLGARRNS